MLCPATYKHCPDDLCHGSGCMINGMEMLPQCHLCGGAMVSD